MPLLEHLRELRARIRNSTIAFLVTSTVAFAYAKHIRNWIIQPLREQWDEKKLGPFHTVYTQLTEPFWVDMKISIYAGIFAASPYIFYQLWKFIGPGLKKNEKQIAVPFAVFSGLFFCGGGAFCYLLVFKPFFGFFLSYAAQELQPMLSLGFLIDIAIKMMLAFGLVFELPLMIYFLARIGLVTHRSLWKFNKYWIVISFIVGAVLTPGPDVISQILMATPLVVLYQVSIVVALVVTKGRERRRKAAGLD